MQLRTAGLALLCLILSAAFCAADADVTLRYKMAAGDVLEYQVTSLGTGTVTSAGRTDPLRSEASFRYVITCEAVDEEGNMTLRHQMLEPVVQAVYGTQQLPVNLAIPTVTTIITPAGTVLETRVEPAPGPEGAAAGARTPGGALPGLAGGQLPFDVGQFLGDLRGPGFPEQAVSPGDRWEQTLNLTTRSGQPMPVKYVTRLIDLARLHGNSCARLQTDYELPLDVNLLGGTLVRVSGTQKGSQVAYFAHETGRVLRFDGTSDTSLTMTSPGLFGAAGQPVVSLTLRSTTSAVLQAPAPPDA